MRTQIFLGTLAALAAMLGTAAVSQGQETPPPAPAKQKDQKPAPRPRKVWTNDDFASLPRADADSKGKGTLSTVGAPAEQDAQAKAAQAPPANTPPPNIIVPKSLEEADKMVQQSTVFSNDEAIALARKQKELEEAPEDKKADLQKELEMHKRYLNDSRQELKALQDKKKEMEKKQSEAQAGSQTASQKKDETEQR